MQKDSKEYDQLSIQATKEALARISYKSECQTEVLNAYDKKLTQAEAEIARLKSDHPIQRLGFGAWADDKIANYIEDWLPTMSMGTGKMSVEAKDYTLYAEYGDKDYTIVIRAHTPDGWQMHQRTIKFKEGEKK
jgi:DNA-binding GntR family transcriptional regulator